MWTQQRTPVSARLYSKSLPHSHNWPMSNTPPPPPSPLRNFMIPVRSSHLGKWWAITVSFSPGDSHHRLAPSSGQRVCPDNEQVNVLSTGWNCHAVWRPEYPARHPVNTVISVTAETGLLHGAMDYVRPCMSQETVCYRRIQHSCSRSMSHLFPKPKQPQAVK